MLPNPDMVKGMYVSQYTFLDELSFIGTPQKLADANWFETYTEDQINSVVDAVKRKFLSSGWEGDGDIGIIWLPPFIDFGIEDTYGNYLWHVKQNNNGISYILSHFSLNFKRIKEQNQTEEELQTKGVPVSIVYSNFIYLKNEVSSIKKELMEKLEELSGLEKESFKSSIKNDLLIHYQGILISRLHDFMNDCYLSVLIEALSGNSSGIKLKKSRVHLSFIT